MWCTAAIQYPTKTEQHVSSLVKNDTPRRYVVRSFFSSSGTKVSGNNGTHKIFDVHKITPKNGFVVLYFSQITPKRCWGGGQQSRGLNLRVKGQGSLDNLIKYNTTVVITLLLWCWSVYLVRRISYFTATFRFK